MLKNTIKTNIRTAALMLALLIVLPLSGSVFADGTPQPEPVSDCVYSCSSGKSNLKSVLSDDEYSTYLILRENAWVGISWEGDADFVYWEWTDPNGVAPQPYTVELLDPSGDVLETKEGERYWNSGTEIPEGVSGVRITMLGYGRICKLKAYSGGAPSDYHPWQPTPDKTDFMIIATHPDDDALFMGAIIPTYGAERGLSGSVLYMVSRWRVRCTEALNGAWTMGLRTYPLFGGMKDVSNDQREELEDEFRQTDAERIIVRNIRKVRPEVVITHDLNGEYGHWQHIVVANAVRRAVILAANPSYDKKSYELYGAWQVKKLYMHLYGKDKVTVSALVPLEAFGGKTAWDVAREAYECHRSQNRANHPCNNSGVNSLERFGLVFTTVGKDTGTNDLFEHIDAGLLTGYTPQATEEPTPEPPETTEQPTPEPSGGTEKPTPAPSPAPTAVQTAAPTAASTPAPTDYALDGPVTPLGKLGERGLAVAAGTAAIVLLPLAALLIANRLKRNK